MPTLSDTTIEMNTIIKRHVITNFVSLSKTIIQDLEMRS